MSKWQSTVLKVIGWMLGLKGEAKLVFIQFDNEPTINDLIKNKEEDEMNRQADKETGE
jgi:hypothetical protein